jgi:hypothetical protein
VLWVSAGTTCAGAAASSIRTRASSSSTSSMRNPVPKPSEGLLQGWQYLLLLLRLASLHLLRCCSRRGAGCRHPLLLLLLWVVVEQSEPVCSPVE